MIKLSIGRVPFILSLSTTERLKFDLCTEVPLQTITLHSDSDTCPIKLIMITVHIPLHLPSLLSLSNLVNAQSLQDSASLKPQSLIL